MRCSLIQFNCLFCYGQVCFNFTFTIIYRPFVVPNMISAVEILLHLILWYVLIFIGVGEGVAGGAAAPLVEHKFATFGQFS